MSSANVFSVAGLLLVTAAPAARSAIIMAAGDVEILAAPPASVLEGELESNDVARVFFERRIEGFVWPITVNAVSPGEYRGLDLTNTIDISPSSFESYFVHFDPIGTPGRSDPFQTVSASFTFDLPVIGLILVDRQLWDSESIGVRALSTTYPPDVGFSARGWDPADVSFDVVSLSADRRTVTFSAAARTPGDQFRILTVAVPEPASLVLWCILVFLIIMLPCPSF